MLGPRTSTPIDIVDAVPLGYTLVDAVAKRVGARALAIKGPIATAHGLREPGCSNDVDVLVAPDDFERVQDALEAIGWRALVDDPRAWPFPQHAVTMTHLTWPVTVDLHYRFPGFLADSEVVFEALWSDRALVEIADQQIRGVGLLGSTLIGTLNALRAPVTDTDARRFNFLAMAWVEAGHDCAPLLELASTTGAGQTAALLFERLGAPSPVIAPGLAEALGDWELQNQLSSARGLGWTRTLMDAPWRRRPAILWRIFFTQSEARLRRNGMRPDGTGRRRAQARYAYRVVMDLPRAVRDIRSKRRYLERLRRP